MSASTPSQLVEIFFSYSHSDEALRDELERHLVPLKRDQTLSTWHDRNISAGEQWKGEIDQQLASADIVLLLVSSDFLASDFCHYEMRCALDRHHEGDAVVIPILLRPCLWKVELGDLQALPRDNKPVISAPNRDAAFLEVVEGILAAIKARASSKDKSDELRRIFQIPFRPNPFFTGREEILAKLRETLTAESRAALGQTAAISGLGGIGKTQTALHYAERHRYEYRAVFFARADNESELLASFAAIARSLDLPLANDQDLSLIRDAVVRWLELEDRWLLIFDNADEPGLIEPFLPNRYRGHVLLTSRAQNFDMLGIRHPVQLATFQPNEAVDFLLTRTGHEQTGSDEKEAAAELAEELGYLALALEQAGAYIAEMDVLFAEYLASYRQRGLELLDRGRSPVEEDRTVTATWSLNFEKVEAESTASAALLRACAFLGPQDIPEEILTEAASELGPTLEKALSHGDPLAVAEMLRPLRRFSLIDRDASTRTWSVHRLVQKVVRQSLDDQSRRRWAARIVNALGKIFPDEIEFSVWPLCERLLAHARVAEQWIEQHAVKTRLSGRLLNQTGCYLLDRAQYRDSFPLLKRALDIRVTATDEDHLEVAASFNDLAYLLIREGRFTEAESLVERALRIRERELGEQHSKVASCLSLLGVIFRGQGRHREAEPLFYRALRIQETQQAEADANTASCLNNLASIYSSQARYSESEPLLERALDIWEKLFDGKHPKMGPALNNLGSLYRDQRRYSEAEALYERALKIQLQALGDQHPDFACSLSNLAALHQRQNRFARAASLTGRSLKIFEKQLGDHPDTATALENHAQALASSGRRQQSVKVKNRAKAMRKRLAKREKRIAASLAQRSS